jgi:hypothetical protein
VGKWIDKIHSEATSDFNKQISEMQGPKENIGQVYLARNNDDLGANANQKAKEGR